MRKILLPANTTLSTGQVPATPVVLNEDQLAIMMSDASGNISIFTPSSAVVFTVPCGSLSVAVSVISQLKNFVASKSANTVFSPYVGNPSLTWGSINPDAYSVSSGDQSSFTIIGTGFVAAGVNSIKFTDGGVSLTSQRIIAVSDTIMKVILPSGLQPVSGYPAAYSVNYSTPASGTYISTGLTVTVSP